MRRRPPALFVALLLAALAAGLSSAAGSAQETPSAGPPSADPPSTDAPPLPPVPEHPRALVLPDLPFAVPEAAGYRHELSNGVPVYVVEDSSLPLVDVTVAVRAGDWLDPPGKAGLASLAGQLVRRGGSARFTADQLDERFDLLAAQVDSTGGTTRSGATLNVLSSQLPAALELFFEMVAAPRFEQGRLELVRAGLTDSMGRRNLDPGAVLGREWAWLLYGREHFSTRPVTPGDLAAIERTDLLAFHRRTWCPANMVLAVSGDVETEAIVARLEELFAGWEVGEPAAWPPPAPEHRPAPGLYHLERDLDQGRIALGHLGAARRGWDDPDFSALRVMSSVLGEGQLVSRIGGRVRGVEGLAYVAGARFQVGDLWPGDFQIYIEAANRNLPRAAELALEEVERIERYPPSSGELTLAKRSLLDGFPLLFDSAEEIAGYFAEDELLGRPHSFWTGYRERIEAVSSRDVRRVARGYLRPEKMVIVTMGRWREIVAGQPGGGDGDGDQDDGDGRDDGGELLEKLAGGEVVRLPERDPLTLEAATAAARSDGEGRAGRAAGGGGR